MTFPISTINLALLTKHTFPRLRHNQISIILPDSPSNQYIQHNGVVLLIALWQCLPAFQQALLLHDRSIELEGEFNRYSALALALIHSDPAGREPADLPIHINDITSLLNDFRRLEYRLPPPLFARCERELQNILDLLEEMQSVSETCMEGARAPPGQTWENVDGRRRKLVLDLQLLQVLVEEGMTDNEIAEYMCCSRRTVQRRRQDEGLVTRIWTPLSDEDLNEVNRASLLI